MYDGRAGVGLGDGRRRPSGDHRTNRGVEQVKPAVRRLLESLLGRNGPGRVCCGLQLGDGVRRNFCASKTKCPPPTHTFPSRCTTPAPPLPPLHPFRIPPPHILPPRTPTVSGLLIALCAYARTRRLHAHKRESAASVSCRRLWLLAADVAHARAARLRARWLPHLLTAAGICCAIPQCRVLHLGRSAASSRALGGVCIFSREACCAAEPHAPRSSHTAHSRRRASERTRRGRRRRSMRGSTRAMA